MKRITQLLTALVFCSLIIFVSCKKKKKPDATEDPRDAAGQALAGPWVPTSVKFDDANRTEWSDFVISFAYNTDTDQGNYTVSGVPTDDGASDVWGTANGTVNWTFDGIDETADVGRVIRADGTGTPMDVTVNSTESPTALTISFTVEDPDARVAGFYGTWSFVFELQ
ncbi:MAG: hypothetical protein RIC35_18035 [Marinoscillum sp.]